MKNDYIYDDSVVSVSYDFWTKGGDMKFTIANRSDRLIYMNWKKCSFCYKGNNFPYQSDSNLSFRVLIPPNGMTIIDKFSINQPFVKSASYPEDIDTTRFTEDNSILYFSNCLEYSFSKDFTNPTYVDNDFWVKNVITVNGAYYTIPQNVKGAFYTKKKQKTRRVVLVLGVAAVVFSVMFVML